MLFCSYKKGIGLPSGGHLMNLAERNELIKASPAIQVQSKMTLLHGWGARLKNVFRDTGKETGA